MRNPSGMFQKEVNMNSAMVINKSGTLIDYDAAVMLMDDDLREELHAVMAPCTEQEFFAAYEVAHEAKYGEEWELSKVSPQY